MIKTTKKQLREMIREALPAGISGGRASYYDESNKIDIDDMLRAYLEAALWSTTDWDSGEPLDDTYGVSDISEEAVESSRKDCTEFVEMAGRELSNLSNSSQVGHDFWLTRNHHGAGFWDRDEDVYPEGVGEKLTKIAHSFGEVDMYVADEEDGKIHI